MIFFEDVRVGIFFFDIFIRNFLFDSEFSGEEKEYEERIELNSSLGLFVVEERFRVKIFDWLVIMDMGFRCMVCCRVFFILESF